MFADDTSLSETSANAKELTSNLQISTNQLVEWTKFNHMALSKIKTKCMYITTRQKRDKMTTQFPCLYINKTIIEEVDQHKHLGILIDNNLSWSDHISSLAKRLSQKNYQLSKIKHFLNLNSRKTFFYGHFLSLMNYASTIWDSASATNLNMIKRLHKRAVKLILLKSSSLTPTDYRSLNILPFSDRLTFNKFTMMNKIINGKAPPYLNALFVKNTSRHKHQLTFPRPRNNLFKSSLVHSGGTLWNNLPFHLKSITNLKNFKFIMKKHLLNNLTI